MNTVGEQRRGTGRQDVIDALSRRYRLWAVLPADVLGLAAIAGPDDGIAAVVPRPPFPPGVCQSCGCQEDDPCLTGLGPCAWADEARTRCTACEAPDLRRGSGDRLVTGRSTIRRTKGGPTQRRRGRR